MLLAIQMKVFWFQLVAVVRPYTPMQMSVGVMQRTSTQAVVVEETADIPFITKDVDPKFGFGYRIEFNNDSPYQHKMILLVPYKTILTGDTPAIINETDSYRIVSYPEESVTEFSHLFIRLSEEDPSGLYKVESYINGKLFRVIEFNSNTKTQLRIPQPCPNHSYPL